MSDVVSRGSDLQQRLWLSLREYSDLEKVPEGFLTTVLHDASFTGQELAAATSSIYAEVYYRFAKDSHVSAAEQRYLDGLQRVLELSDEVVIRLAYRVGLTIYKRQFRDAVADGELTTDELSGLDELQRLFRLKKRDIRKAIADQALAFYSFQLSDALRDGVLSDDEMSTLASTARRFGLTSRQLNSISVPNKREILATALASIKARGEIRPEDRDHICAVAEYINAGDLLKPCLMDLDLYERIFAIRSGDLPVLKSDQLILEPGETLHYAVPITLETQAGGKVNRQTGTLYIGSMRMRFVGLRRSHEIRYRNLLEVNFQIQKHSKLTVKVARGSGGGVYRPKNNDPGLLIELQEAIRFLVRKAKGLEGNRQRDSRYIPTEVRSEVWYRDNGQCVICGATEYLEFDHIIPHSKGGATSVDNLQLLCRGCNSQKRDSI
ncbi:hypothetical protein GC176_26130 [bacterium]|nr:hypothetical protein [bacterium]